MASLPYTCDCFRARWKRLNNGEKFSRVTAIRMWKWLERAVGHENVMPVWEERDPELAERDEFRWRGELIHDELSPEPKSHCQR